MITQNIRHFRVRGLDRAFMRTGLTGRHGESARQAAPDAIHSVISCCTSWSGIGNDSGRNVYTFRSENENACVAVYGSICMSHAGVAS
jgi:hypothetical protein